MSDANVIITTPFHPAYMTRELIEKAPKLELIVTAGVGSDHIDLHAAADKGITVAEVITFCARPKQNLSFYQDQVSSRMKCPIFVSSM